MRQTVNLRCIRCKDQTAIKLREHPSQSGEWLRVCGGCYLELLRLDNEQDQAFEELFEDAT
jgi:hypothetical protein